MRTEQEYKRIIDEATGIKLRLSANGSATGEKDIPAQISYQLDSMKKFGEVGDSFRYDTAADYLEGLIKEGKEILDKE